MPSGISVGFEPAAPVAFDFGREPTMFVDPYTGMLLGEEPPKLRAFFLEVEGLHRWLGSGSERRASGRAINGSMQPRLSHSGDYWPIPVVAERNGVGEI